MLNYELNKKQFKALQGLAFHVANLNYFKTRNNAETVKNELPKLKDNINAAFTELDRLSVPFWVQNIVISFSEDFRRYSDIYLDQYLLQLDTVNITIK